MADAVRALLLLSDGVPPGGSDGDHSVFQDVILQYFEQLCDAPELCCTYFACVGAGAPLARWVPFHGGGNDSTLTASAALQQARYYLVAGLPGAGEHEEGPGAAARKAADALRSLSRSLPSDVQRLDIVWVVPTAATHEKTEEFSIHDPMMYSLLLPLELAVKGEEGPVPAAKTGDQPELGGFQPLQLAVLQLYRALRTLLVINSGSKSMSCSRRAAKDSVDGARANDVASFGPNDMACGPRRSDRRDTCCESCGYTHDGYARQVYRAHLHILQASEPAATGTTTTTTVASDHESHSGLEVAARWAALLEGTRYGCAWATGANQSDTDSALDLKANSYRARLFEHLDCILEPGLLWGGQLSLALKQQLPTPSAPQQQCQQSRRQNASDLYLSVRRRRSPFRLPPGSEQHGLARALGFDCIQHLELAHVCTLADVMCWPHLLSPTCVIAKVRSGSGICSGTGLTVDDESTLEAAVRAFLCHDTATHAPALALLLRGVRRSQSSSSNGNGIETQTCPTFVCFWAGTELVLRPFDCAFHALAAVGASSCRELLSAATARGTTAAACIPTWFMSNNFCNQRRQDGIAAEWCAAPLLCDSSTKTDTLLSQQAELAQLMIPILRDETNVNDEPAAKRARRYPPRPRKLCKNCMGCHAAARAASAATAAATMAAKAASAAAIAIRCVQQHESQKALLSSWCREWAPAMTSPEALPYPVLTPFGAQSLVDVADLAARMHFQSDSSAASQSASFAAVCPGAGPGSIQHSISLPVVTAAVPAGFQQMMPATATAVTRPQSVSKAEEKMRQAKQQQKNRRKEALRIASAQGGSRNRRLQRLQSTGRSYGTATPTDRCPPSKATPANVASKASSEQCAVKGRNTPYPVVSATAAASMTHEARNKARLKAQLKRFLRERLSLACEADKAFFRSVSKMAMQTCLLFMNQLQSLGGNGGIKLLKVEAIEQLVADHGLHVVQQMQSMRPKPMSQ